MIYYYMNKYNGCKHFIKLQNNNDTNENIELWNFIFEQLINKNILIKTIENLKNNDKYFYKIKKIINNKDFIKIHITNWKIFIKLIILNTGLYYITKNKCDFLN